MTNKPLTLAEVQLSLARQDALARGREAINLKYSNKENRHSIAYLAAVLLSFAVPGVINHFAKPISRAFQVPYSNPAAVQNYEQFGDKEAELKSLQGKTAQNIADLKQAGIYLPTSTLTSITESLDKRISQVSSDRNTLLNDNTLDIQTYRHSQDREQLIRKYRFPATIGGMALFGALRFADIGRLNRRKKKELKALEGAH